VTLTHADYGRMGGAPMTSGSVTTSYGGILSSLHITRLQRMAAKATGRDREHLEAAIACLKALTAKNRRLGAQIGATMKRKLLTHRGVILSGSPEAIAADIAELAASHKVTAYREKRRVRVTTANALAAAGEPKRIGTYDIGCDYRHVLDDVRDALAA